MRRGLERGDVDARAPLAQAAVRLVEHDARQPGRQGRLAAEGRKSGEGVRVGLLHHVLGLGIVAYHGARDPEQELVRSEEHTSALQAQMRISYAVVRLKKQHKRIKILSQQY